MTDFLQHDRPDPAPDIDRREAIRRVASVLGGTLSASAIAGVLAGCGASELSAEGVARAFTPAQLELVATIAEHIIPTTDTPGARSAGVHRFIDRMMAEYYLADERAHFVAGLTEVDARARRERGRSFMRSSAQAQRAQLEQLDRETFSPRTAAETTTRPDASKETERGGGGTPATARPDSASRSPTRSLPPFFRTMKELTLLGYYTSQVGATRELRYARIPGGFEGCVPLARVGRAWAV